MTMKTKQWYEAYDEFLKNSPTHDEDAAMRYADKSKLAEGVK